MKHINVTTLLVLLMLVAQTGLAQISIPRPSPTATLTQAVGLTEFEINYSRPGVKKRTIMGDLVPYGKVWRTGANQATTIKFEHDIKMGGKDIAAGEYALYTMPGEKEWTVMIYKDTKLGGAVDNYKEADELTRFTVMPRKLNDMVESFTIDWSNFTNGGATLVISWENTALDIEVSVPTDEMVMTSIKDQLIEPKGPGARTYAGAASYYADNGKDMEQALEWMNKAVELRPEAFWYVYRQAKLLRDLGKTKEAIAASEKSLEMAKASEDGDYGYIKNNEELLMELKKKK